MGSRDSAESGDEGCSDFAPTGDPLLSLCNRRSIQLPPPPPLKSSTEPTGPSLNAGRVAAALTRTLEAAGAALLAALFLVVCVAVVRRYGAGGGFAWSDEAAIWLLVALVAVGMPLAAAGPLAMRLDFAVSRLPGRARGVADLLGDAIIVHAALVIAFGGGSVAMLVGGTSTVLGLPEGLRFAFFSGAGLLTIVMVLSVTVAKHGAHAASLVAALGFAFYGLVHASWWTAVATPSLVAGGVAAGGLVLGAPLPWTLIAAASWAGAFGGLLPEPAIVQNAVAGVSKFLLLAIPFFLLAGELLTRGGLAQRLVRFAAAMVGGRRSGLAQTTLLTSVLFSGASGSSVANAAFGARVMAPALVSHGYSPPKAAAIVAASSMLDNIIPPSIAFLILAAATNLSVGSLLVGGVVAGGVLAAALAVAFDLTASPARSAHPPVDRRERVSSFFGALPAIGLAVIVVIGIRFGVVTVTEASALAVAYALVTSLILRGLEPQTIRDSLVRAASDAAAIGFLIAACAPLVFLTAVDGVPQTVTGLLASEGRSATTVMFAAVGILLLAGLVLDIGAGLLLFAPLLLPAALAAGIDPIHFGVIVVVALMIGGLTPPVGILVLVVSGAMRLPAEAVFRSVLPYLGALLAGLAFLCGGALLWPTVSDVISRFAP
jgi:tripartite ATP-independent transporter DctM subunit